MRAVVCAELTGPEGLSVGEMPEPDVGSGMVQIAVHAASLNFPDVLITQGKYQFKPPLPFTPGGEGAGVVLSVGQGVTRFKAGDRVMFMSQYGAFAETISVPEMMIVPLPDAMPYEEGSALTITYGTTLHALKQRGQLAEGETLLVLGAAGGVGQAAIEIGKAMGAVVVAAASSAEKLEACKTLGADHLINYSEEDLKSRLKEITGGKGVDVTYDPVGGAYSETCFRAMAPGGRHLVIGFAAGDIPALPINLCLLKQASLVGVFWGAWAMANPKGQYANMAQLFDWYGAGTIKPRLHATYGVDDIKTAYSDLTERRAVGKVVLVTR